LLRIAIFAPLTPLRKRRFVARVCRNPQQLSKICSSFKQFPEGQQCCLARRTDENQTLLNEISILMLLLRVWHGA
jgi:hypothetical protein